MENILLSSMLAQRGKAGGPVPVGGTAGQVIVKDSSTDFDVSWKDTDDLSAVTDLKSAIDYGYVSIGSGKFKSGLWHNTEGVIANTNGWVAGPIQVKAGDELYLDSGSLYVNLALTNGTTALIENLIGNYTNFANNIDETIEIESSGFLFINVRNAKTHASASPISQSNIDVIARLTNSVAGDLAPKVAKLITDLDISYPYSEIETLKGMWRANGTFSGSVRFVCSADYIPSNVDHFTVGTNFKAQVIIYTNGTITRSYWYGKDTSLDPFLGDTFTFDHANHKYKVNVAYANERVYTDAEYETLMSSGIIFSCTPNVLIKYCKENVDNFQELVRRSGNIHFANASEPISVANPIYSISGDQPMHPKVLYFENGLFSHNYWMAYTPYVDGDVQYENPCIAYSDDGITWTGIANNPLQTTPANGYNSDTHLIYRSDLSRLECWFRELNSSASEENIYRCTSTDGLTWTSPELIHQSTGGTAKCLSPCAYYDNGYKIWTVSNSGGYHIEYFESTDGTDWNHVRDIDLTYTYDGDEYSIWHIDVQYIDSAYVGMFMCKGTDEWVLFYSKSTDNITWSNPKILMVPNPLSWDTSLYRSCFIKNADVYRIYYSAKGTIWGIGIAESPVFKSGYFIGEGVLPD